MTEPLRYSETIAVRLSPAVGALVAQAAIKRGQKPSEWVRQAVLTGLQLDGFDPTSIDPAKAVA